MLKKFPLDKINGTKNTLCFLSQAQTHHSFTFDLGFLNELKQFSIIDSVSFSLKIIFLFIKMHGLFDFKTS